MSILCFGRMEHYKGVEVLLEAARLARSRGLDFTLHLAGRGPELDRLESAFTVIPGVTVENRYIPPLDIIDAIETADCAVLPYLSATQSGVLAAALANGRCVIASRVGGIPDVVEHMVNGILTPPSDPDALADAFALAAGDKALRERLQFGARTTAATRLNWDFIADKLAIAYWD